MATRNQILSNPLDFSVEELYEAIQEKIVTYDELCAIQEFPYKRRDQLKKRLNMEEPETAQPEIPEPTPDPEYVSELIPEPMPELEPIPDIDPTPVLESVLESVSIEDLLETIGDIEADKTLVNAIEEIANCVLKYLQKGGDAVTLLMEEIKKNKNLLPDGVIRILLEKKPNLESPLADAVGLDFMKALKKPYSHQSSLPIVKTPEKIERTSTEFYFWGIPASGKTCLMASLLSVANSGKVEDVKGMSPDASCSGYNYLTYLMDFFSDEGHVLRLMPGNGENSVAEMGFDLIDSKGGIHPITFVDMPGEAFKAMHRKLAGDSNNPFEGDLKTVNNLLVDEKSNSNQKVHIFVIEYGAHNKKDKYGTSQQIYLQSAATYIKEKGIFDKRTDMICIIFTKADLAEGGPENFDWKKYLEDHYNGFFTNLRTICNKCEINNGEPVKFWFSIGDVCFRAYCKYNEEAAHKVLNFIVDRTWRHKKWRGILSK